MDELIYYFVDDNEVLELINSVSSYTMNDKSIKKSKKESQIITFWDTTKVTTMENMFYNKKRFNELLLWNTSNVVTMSLMFYNASSFNQPLEFNTDNVSDMCDMFKNSGMKKLHGIV